MSGQFQTLLVTLDQEFSAIRDEAKADQMAAYMKNLFPFYGVQSRDRKNISNRLWSIHKSDILNNYEEILRALWASSNRESQYVAMDWLAKFERKLDFKDLPLIEDLVCWKSWWDTVDWLASHAVGIILGKNADQQYAVTARYVDSNNMWLQRTALLFQLNYKEKTDSKLLFDLIDKNLGSSEFFINKAIGWALRQYSKTDKLKVAQYVAENKSRMANLSIREASKYL